MRLINTETLTLEEFIREEPPAYAILSHTWDDDEVTFDEFKKDPTQLKCVDGKDMLRSRKPVSLPSSPACDMPGSTRAASIKARLRS
jgi:hypothetical protein